MRGSTIYITNKKRMHSPVMGLAVVHVYCYAIGHPFRVSPEPSEWIKPHSKGRVVNAVWRDV